MVLNQINAFLNNNEFFVQNFIFSIGPLSAFIAARRGLKSWLKYEIFVSFFIGLVLILKPHFILPHLLYAKELTNYHWFWCSLYGVYLIASSLHPLFLLNSNDESVFYGHFWARLLSSSLILIDNIFVYNQNSHWNYRLLCTSGSFAVAQLLINSYYLYSSKQPRGINSFDRDPVNHVARFEAFVLILTGISMYAFPDLIMSELKKSDETYRSLCRTCGAIIFSLSFESFCLVEFIYLKDKKTFMLFRLLGSLLELVITFVGCYCLNAISTNTLLTLVATNGTYNLLVFYGYIITPQDVKKLH